MYYRVPRRQGCCTWTWKIFSRVPLSWNRISECSNNPIYSSTLCVQYFRFACFFALWHVKDDMVCITALDKSKVYNVFFGGVSTYAHLLKCVHLSLGPGLFSCATFLNDGNRIICITWSWACSFAIKAFIRMYTLELNGLPQVQNFVLQDSCLISLKLI